MAESKKRKVKSSLSILSAIQRVLVGASSLALLFSCMTAFTSLISSPGVQDIISALQPESTPTPLIIIQTASAQPTYTPYPTYTPPSGTAFVIITSTPDSAISTAIANITREIFTSNNRLDELERLILRDPVKALELTTLHDSLGRLQDDLDEMEEDVSRLEDQNFKATLSLFTIVLAIVGAAGSAAIGYLQGKRRRDEEVNGGSTPDGLAS